MEGHGTSPLTNLQLPHRRVFKLASLEQVFDCFMSVCRTRQGVARAEREHCMEQAAHGTVMQRLLVLKEMESSITDLSLELEA